MTCSPGSSACPAGGTKPKARIVAHVRTGSRRWIGAATGGCHDGENTLVDELAGTVPDSFPRVRGVAGAPGQFWSVGGDQDGDVTDDLAGRDVGRRARHHQIGRHGPVELPLRDHGHECLDAGSGPRRG
jgi:hypothetical protein